MNDSHETLTSATSNYQWQQLLSCGRHGDGVTTSTHHSDMFTLWFRKSDFYKSICGVSRWRFTPPPVFGYTCDIDQICNMTVTIATEDTEFWLAGEFALFSITKRFILTAGWLLVSTAPPAGWRSKVYSDRIFILSLFRSGLNWSEDSRLKVY